MKAYVIIGTANARKSSVMRSLTGADKRSRRDIALVGGGIIDIYARISSLQESKTTPNEFLDETRKKGCKFVIFCLWPQSHRKFPGYPDATTYLKFFSANGWDIHRVAVLGSDTTHSQYPNAHPFPSSRSAPINVTAEEVRKHFDWL